MIPSNTADLFAALRQSGIPPNDLGSLLNNVPADIRQRLDTIDQGLLRAVLRHAATGEAVTGYQDILSFLRSCKVSSMFQPEIERSKTLALPTAGQIPAMPAFSDPAFDQWFAGTHARYGLGLYGENRSVYATAQFADEASEERRTVHLGIDVFAPAQTAVFAPVEGKVYKIAYNADPLDYGNTLILEHDAGGRRYFTLYGHLAGTLTSLLSPGQPVSAGQHIADLGDWNENGGWAPHLHFQIITDLLEQTEGNFFGVGHASLWDIWKEISPDPNLLLRLPEDRFTL